jgi:hypothetical protein
MARCGDESCSCLVQAGDGIQVSGSGTQSNPYIITSDLPDFSQSLSVRDTATINLTLSGSGREADPFVLSGTSSLKMTDLSDVADPEGGPIVGDVPVWVGAGVLGHWEFRAPPPAPAGAVNATGGIIGIGSGDDPLKVAVSGVWGVGDLSGLGADTTIGLETYIDVSGKLRVQPPPAGTVDWGSVTGKPTSFAPSAHTHTASQITDQSNLNAGKVNGVRIYSTANSTPPTVPTPVTGDLHFFPA